MVCELLSVKIAFLRLNKLFWQGNIAFNIDPVLMQQREFENVISARRLAFGKKYFKNNKILNPDL